VGPRTLIGLIICNLIWSLHPAMAKSLLTDFSPAQVAWLRYGSALLSYFAVVLAFRSFRPFSHAIIKPFWVPRTRHDWVLLFAMGFFPFCFSPLLQLTGLAASRAVDNALIVAMEPLVTVVLAWLVLREAISLFYAFTFGLALFGFGLLTGVQPGSAEWNGHLIGNLLILVSMGGEAAYSVFGRKLTARHEPVAIFGSAITAGVIFLTMAGPFFGIVATGFTSDQFTLRNVLCLLWMGPLGTMATYLYWMIALSRAPVAALAITLFIQPLFGALWGYAFLEERLSLMQAAGGGLILLAVLVSMWRRSNPKHVGCRDALGQPCPGAPIPPNS